MNYKDVKHRRRETSSIGLSVLPVRCRDQPPGQLWRCPLSHQSGGSPSPPNHSPEPVCTWNAAISVIRMQLGALQAHIHEILHEWKQSSDARFDGLSHRANLVDFKQQTVAGFFLHSSLNPAGVCHSQIISNNLQRKVPENMKRCFVFQQNWSWRLRCHCGNI